jgi:hypothetical protein
LKGLDPETSLTSTRRILTESDELSRPKGVLRSLVCGTIFALALAATALGLRARLPERANIPVVSKKLAAIAARGEAIDTLFFGTSRVFYQIDPQVFDARMAELGTKVSSYNLAADGMNFPETFYVLEHALKAVPHLKLVVFEIGSMQHGDNPIFNEGSLRTYYWRDLPRTWTIIRSICRSPKAGTWREKADKIRHQLELMAPNFSNLGRGSEMLTGWLGLSGSIVKEVVPASGYVAVDRRISASDLRTFRERMKTKLPPDELPVREDPELRERLNELVARLRGRGVEPCFLYLPAFRKDRPELPTNAGAKPVLVMDFDNPNEHPEFFREDHYYDVAHLNKTGSVIFTRKLSEAVHQHLADPR